MLPKAGRDVLAEDNEFLCEVTQSAGICSQHHIGCTSLEATTKGRG
jgi:hypothetical protein